MPPPEIQTHPTVSIQIPVQFSRLRDMAYNLWWSWSPQAHGLFYTIDPSRWLRYRNPIELLIDMEPERWHALQSSNEFIRSYRAVVEQFDAYMAPDDPTWFDRSYPDYDGGPIAYFSTEFGWHECLQIYSGGLGILSGDHSKSASELGLPFVGVGLMYRHGYFRQTIDADGQQQHFYPDYDLHRVPMLPVVGPEGKELRVGLELAERTVLFRVWKADVGRVPVLLLDTDLPENHPADRPITSILYIRGREMRLCQELVLGLGGVRVLEALGITPAVWHLNEGHSALLVVERLARRIERGVGLERARAELVAETVFTTHTPVLAGNESFDAGMVRRYLEPWSQRFGGTLDEILALGRAGAEDDGSFNLTALALRSCARANGVSELHGRVAGGMWNPLLEAAGRPGVEHITNGVHTATWIGPEIRALLARHLGEPIEDRLLDADLAAAVEAIPDQELWEAHTAQKLRLIALIRGRVRDQRARHGHSPDELRQLERLLDPDMLLVGFARRFATYKRADLILRDLETLKRIVASADRPVQLLFAGKAHPADRPGQELIRRIWETARDPGLQGRLLFIEDYDLRMARSMIQGVDVWLNTPRRPMEASGTSGMKAAVNGGLNFSVLDGWWCEGYDPSYGWSIGGADDLESEDQTDQRDAESLYRRLADEIVPCFYERSEQGLPVQWIARMRRAIVALAPRFSTARMVREYTRRYYLPAARGELR